MGTYILKAQPPQIYGMPENVHLFAVLRSYPLSGISSCTYY